MFSARTLKTLALLLAGYVLLALPAYLGPAVLEEISSYLVMPPLLSIYLFHTLGIPGLVQQGGELWLGDVRSHRLGLGLRCFVLARCGVDPRVGTCTPERAAARRLKLGPIVRRIGLISDTHGLLRREAIAFLRGSDYIVHAGDIGDAAVLVELGAVAPVTAVRGNNDSGAWAKGIAETEVLKVGGISIYVLHDLAQLDLDPLAAGYQVVVSGHSHKPLLERRGGVLYVNPGSAGPRRFKLPIAAAELR